MAAIPKEINKGISKKKKSVDAKAQHVRDGQAYMKIKLEQPTMACPCPLKYISKRYVLVSRTMLHQS
jgi:hypothetical protein